MAILKDKFKELEQNKDIHSLIELLNSNKWQHRYKAIVSLINIRDSSAMEEVKAAMNDENSVVRETAINYLRMNNAYPKTKIEDIKIYPFDIKNSYTRIKKITASSDDSIHSESAANEDINNKLKEEAVNLGANAIIDVKYRSGIFNLFKGVKGQGMAVTIEDITEEVKPVLEGRLYLGALNILWALVMYLQYGYNAAALYFIYVWLLCGIFWAFSEIFIIKGYKNKTYFLVFFGLFTSSTLLYVNYAIKNGFNDPILYLPLLGILIYLVYEYQKRKNDPKIGWKDQWGFN